MAARKPRAKPKPRSKITLEMPTALKRRLMAFAASRGEHPWRVVERAVRCELADFRFEGGPKTAPGRTADQATDPPLLKVG
jgi:hypothetical protein